MTICKLCHNSGGVDIEDEQRECCGDREFKHGEMVCCEAPIVRKVRRIVPCSCGAEMVQPLGGETR